MGCLPNLHSHFSKDRLAQWSAPCSSPSELRQADPWPKLDQFVVQQEIRHDKNIISSLWALEKCGLDNSTFREVGSYLNNQYARSLINSASVHPEHSLCPQLCPIQVATTQSWGSELACWHQLPEPPSSAPGHNIHTTPPVFLCGNHSKANPWLAFSAASNSKPLKLTKGEREGVH